MAVGEEKRLISREPAEREGRAEIDEGPGGREGGVGGKGAGKIHRRMGRRDTTE